MNKTIQYTYGFLLLLLAGGLLFLFLRKEKRIAYVELGKVYTEFTMKKDMETRLENISQKRQSLLDSMQFHLELSSKEMYARGTNSPDELAQFEANRQAFMAKKEEFARENEQTAADYDSQIAKKITQYLKTYGKENGYAYILGADGSGVLMYAEEAENITLPIVDYINREFQKEKK
ncbi:MAG: hypothetical protein FD123_633 [Bacteroidetes bacterium]|nr:MAG: hypothetical protein FD123_633 [Bacteroidota bacterium]